MSVYLEARNLTRTANGSILVNEVSFKLEEDEVLVVYGDSGSGKTSLLRILNRLDEPTSGTVLLRGKDYRDFEPTELRRRIGYVPQHPTLTEDTVEENVTVGPRYRGEEVDEGFLADILREIGFEDRRNAEVRELSGGEKQLVSLARTLMNRPEAVLLDEPTSHLDPGSKREVEELIDDVMGYGDSFDVTVESVIWVTHDTEQARRVADRIAVFEDGGITKTGDDGVIE
ncbi:MAG: ATP-binding cassette domain-containing protein [Halobacteria archaeon]